MSTNMQVLAFPIKVGVDTHVVVDLGATGKVKGDIDSAVMAFNGGVLAPIDASDYDLSEIGNNLYQLELTDLAVATAGEQLVLVSGATITRNTVQLFRTTKSVDDLYTDLGNATVKVSPATNSVDANAIKADGATKIATAVFDKDISGYSVAGQAGTYIKGMVAAVWASGTRELTGLGATAIAGIWNAATSGMATGGSIGKLIKDNLDATISSVATAVGLVKTQTDKMLFDGSSYIKATPMSAGALSTADKNDIADRVWDELQSGHVTAGSMGLQMLRIRAYVYGKRKLTSGGLVEEIYDEDGATLISTHTLTKDVDGNVTTRSQRS